METDEMQPNEQPPGPLDTEPERMLTRMEVARMLGVHRNTVRLIVRKGELAEYKLADATVRYRLQDVRAMIDRARQGHVG